MPTMGRVNNGSTGTSDFGTNSCGGGPVDNSFGWPADAHFISGNDYGPSHLGIDITSQPGRSDIYAAAAGVVTMAQGGDNYGYGNVVQIDHGNGFVTVYAHLSQINVQCLPNRWARGCDRSGRCYRQCVIRRALAFRDPHRRQERKPARLRPIVFNGELLVFQ